MGLSQPKILLNECPACGHRTDRVAGVNRTVMPVPSDLSVCIRCGGISEFDADLRLALVPEAKLCGMEFADVIKARRLVRKMHGMEA